MAELLNYIEIQSKTERDYLKKKKKKLDLLISLAVGFPMWKQNWRAGFCSVNIVFSANRL